MEEVFAGYDASGEPLQYTDVYRFDLVGNCLQKTHDAESDGQIDGTIEYEYDLNDRVLAETQDWLTAADDRYLEYAYGPNNSGTEQTRQTIYEGLSADPEHKLKVTEYEYNLQGRLAEVEIDSDADGTPDQTIQYTYNDSGIRASQSIDEGSGPVVTQYVIDSQNPTGYEQVLEERNAAGAVTKSFTIGYSILAQQSPAIENGETLFLLADGHGSTRLVTDSAGEVLSGGTFTYDAYGNALGFDPATSPVQHLYSGEPQDPATGLQYLRARYYNPQNGRFTRMDPFPGIRFAPRTLHRYGYVGADPVKSVDPSGLMAIGDPAENAARRELNRVRLRAQQILKSGLETLGKAVRATTRGAGRLTTGVRRFFYDPRTFRTISRQYWTARGGAHGASLHHWLIPQSARWVPMGFRNGGFNLVRLPALRGVFHPTLGLNQWMGFAQQWGNAQALEAVLVEWAIRLGIPVAAVASGAGGYYTGESIYDLFSSDTNGTS